MKLRKTFLRGRMNKEADERLLSNGEYRHGENIIIADGDDASSGAIRNSPGNEKLTNMSVGANPVQMFEIADTFNQTLIWGVHSDTQDEIFLYDTKRGNVSSILKDTRGTSTKVLNFDPDYKVDAVLLIDSDNDRRFLIMTDGLNEPRLVNIDTAISWATNGFEADDITLLRPAPKQAPGLTLRLTTSTNENVLKERMLQFAYQYRYADQQYSALSPFSPVAFEPKEFNYDYSTTTNESMVNKWNAVDVGYNTGPDNVEAIRIFFKEPGSRALFLVEEIEKSAESLGDNLEASLTFENDKYYTATAVREDEIDRLYDAVPNNAKRVELIGNRILLSNYTENYDMVDVNGDPVDVDFTVSVNSTAITDDAPVKSLKSNRSYEVAIGYLDSLGRMPAVFTSKTNTAFVSNSLASSENKLQLTINSLAPAWATHYRVFVKEGREGYDVIAPLIFYQDGQYIWLRLEGDDVNKVSKGDFLYVKASSSGLLETAAEVEVLEVEAKDRNFLEEATVTTIEQQAGVYMKIKPKGFSLNESDVSVFDHVCKGFKSRNTDNWILNNADYIEDAVYYGEDGLNDLTVSGTYTGDEDIRYLIEVTTEGTPDQFRWSDNNGTSWTSGVAMTGAAQTLSNGVEVTFGATTGHKTTDSWVVSAKSRHPVDDGNSSRNAWVPLQGKTVAEGEDIREGAVITITYEEKSDGFTILEFNQSFISSNNYANIEEWFFGDQIYDKIDYPFPNNLETGGTLFNQIVFRRGDPVLKKGVTETIDLDPTKDMYMIFRSTSGYSGGSRITVNASINITELDTDVIFETIPAYTDTGLFYEWAESGETFSIDANGYHDFQGAPYTPGATQTAGGPAIVESGAFNCFAWNNGFESYKIKDKLTGRPLKIDSRALSTYPNFRENKRIASMTWSGVYEQTTNLNRINEFNLATQPYKDMDDKYGPISNVLSRDTDVIVWQEDKLHIVPYTKDVLFTASGDGAVTETNKVMGKERPVAGEYGLLPQDFRSVAFFGNWIWWPDAKRGVICRLGGDGINEITYGMDDWFRDRFREGLFGEKLGAYDPYLDKYTLTLKEDTTVPSNEYECGSTIYRYNQSDPYTYIFNAQEFTSQWSIGYNIPSGTATISAVYYPSLLIAGNTGEVSGSGTLNIARTDTAVTQIQVTVTPNTTPADIEIDNNCVKGDTVKVIAMVVFGPEGLPGGADPQSPGTLSWFNGGSGDTYVIRRLSDAQVDGVEVYKVWEGLRSTVDFPDDGETMTLLEEKDGPPTTVELTTGQGWYVLETNTQYSAADVETVIAAATQMTVSNFNTFGVDKNSANLVHTEANGDIIYFVMDYRSLSNQITANDDAASVYQGGFVDINVLGNDLYVGTPVVTITAQPTNGTATALSNGVVRYRNDGTSGADSFTYQLGTVEGSDTDTATVNVTVDPSTGPINPDTDGTAVSMSTAGYAGTSPSDGQGACGWVLGTTRYHNGSSWYPTLNDRVHTASPLTVGNRFDGQNKYYTIPTGRTVKINSDGLVTDVWICSVDGGGGNA